MIFRATIEVSTWAELKTALQNNPENTIKLTADIDMNEVAGPDAPADFEDYTVTVTNAELVAITDGKGRISSINFWATEIMKTTVSVSPDSPSLYMSLP